MNAIIRFACEIESGNNQKNLQLSMTNKLFCKYFSPGFTLYTSASGFQRKNNLNKIVLRRWMEEYGEEIGTLGGKIMGWYR
jgi:hypothetical protein